MLLSSQTGLCGSSVYEVKKRPPPVLGLESNMTAKGLPLDPISMGIDRFGFGSAHIIGCNPVMPREGGIVLHRYSKNVY